MIKRPGINHYLEPLIRINEDFNTIFILKEAAVLMNLKQDCFLSLIEIDEKLYFAKTKKLGFTKVPGKRAIVRNTMYAHYIAWFLNSSAYFFRIHPEVVIDGVSHYQITLQDEN